VLKSNILPQQPVRGDQVLLRLTLYTNYQTTTAYALPTGGMLEFVIARVYGAGTNDLKVYSSDALFRPTDWKGVYSFTNGKICCRLDLDTDGLVDDLGTTEDSALYYCELVLTPAPTSAGKHVTLLQGGIRVRNDLYRAGITQAIPAPSPPALESSSSQTESVSSSSSTVGRSTTSSASSSST